MSFLSTARAATDEEFRMRVMACTFKLAQDVRNEDSSTPNHAVRVGLADAIIRKPEIATDRFAWLCASNPAIAATVPAERDPQTGAFEVGAPDGDIEYVCASNWTQLAQWWNVAGNA